MSEIILHHYPPSPMAEKARLAIGFKGLPWHSVEVPRLPPKPDLFPLTGGYRRVPVMQIGADIYCDTHCILTELEKRSATPTFFPSANPGAALALARWSDDRLFYQAVRIAVAATLESMPPEWVSDRMQLMFGPDQTAEDLQQQMPNTAAQLCAQLGWIDQQLAHNAFVLGDEPSLPDFSIYPIPWVLRARWPSATEAFSQFANLVAWEARMAAIGHGEATEMQSADAIATALACEPETPEQGEPNDPQGLAPGMKVKVCPADAFIEPEVEGILRFVDSDRIGLLHENERVGTICLNFPRVGYRVSPA